MPAFLAEKLRKIRDTVDGGLTQDEMVERLGDEEIDRTYISKYERGVLEPGIKVLLLYSRVANVYLEVLADDDLLLPDDLPCAEKSHGAPRPGAAARRSAKKSKS